MQSCFGSASARNETPGLERSRHQSALTVRLLSPPFFSDLDKLVCFWTEPGKLLFANLCASPTPGQTTWRTPNADCQKTQRRRLSQKVESLALRHPPSPRHLSHLRLRPLHPQTRQSHLHRHPLPSHRHHRPLRYRPSHHHHRPPRVCRPRRRRPLRTHCRRPLCRRRRPLCRQTISCCLPRTL